MEEKSAPHLQGQVIQEIFEHMDRALLKKSIHAANCRFQADDTRDYATRI